MNGKLSSNLNELTLQSFEHLIKRLHAQATDGDPAVRKFALSLLSELDTASNLSSISTLYSFMTDPNETSWSVESKLALQLPGQSLEGIPVKSPEWMRLVLVKNSGAAPTESLYEMAVEFFEVLTVFKETYAQNGQLLFLIKDSALFSQTLQNYHAALEGDLMIKALVLSSPIGRGLQSLNRLYKTLQIMLSIYESKGVAPNSLSATYESQLPNLIAHSLESDFKTNLQDTFHRGFDPSLETDELKRTAEQFLKCNLNITDTAKALFIHRNTLVYRLEKIQKETGFDLRHFDDSWIFRLILAGLIK